MDEKPSSFTASNRRGAAIALAACIFFFAAGQAFIPCLGIENDEAVFANSLFQPDAAYYRWQGVPFMVTSYAGTLKEWIYAPIFRFFGTSVRALREPVLIAAAVTVWLLFLLLRRVAGTRAAVIGACLLAVDSEYLLTSVYDWGPVALQHLLLIGGVLLAVRFAQVALPSRTAHNLNPRSETPSSLALAGAFFLFGLAMWEKALAVWLLSGMAIAAAAIYGREMVKLFTWRRAVIAVLAFSLGALPLIIFNVNTGFETFRKNTEQDTIPISAKAEYLWTASRGGALFGYLVPDDWQTPKPHQPSGSLERAAAFVSREAGHPRRTAFVFVFIAALLAAPFAGRRGIKAIAFCLLTLAVAWFEMAFNANTGGSIHHTILLWPLPQAMAAISLAAVSRRLGGWGAPALAIALAVPLAAGVLVTNEYRAQIVRNGGTTGWTPALSLLTNYMEAHPAGHIFCMDWGMLNTMLLSSDGELKLFSGADPVRTDAPPDAESMRAIQWMLELPGAEFVAHTPANEFFKDESERLIEAAAKLGYRKNEMAKIGDGYGRDIFEVYRFERAESAAASR